MNTQSSGTMRDDEIKRYRYALTENSDGDVPCPRCEVFESLKSISCFQFHDEICGFSTHATFISRMAVPNSGSPPRSFLGFIPAQTASQHLTASARLSCRKLNSLQFSAELQQTAKSVAADSQLKFQSFSAVDHTVFYPFSRGKGQGLCLPWNIRIKLPVS